ncbi:DsrE/DsrF/DrsH-like family protein [Candidatus Chloroploca sp. Khr17]|uniref:DsrE/DsrF/DrsH-like family protein n=1 Tax=Candidatus Chloroploca sp. Khr17 TaxID=2496869 RepID=UPI00101B70A4|nr:DsrE/DsrF/DrsH-like family protein [Candidatus Chloroploca sp. Khr17]
MTIEMSETFDTQTLLERINALESRVNELEAHPSQGVEDRVAMVVFSGELDKAIAAFIIATGAASMGLEVSMFFTFWGLNAVKKQKIFTGKDLLEQGFTAMLPGKLGETGLSQMNFFGAGAQIIRGLMRKHDVSSPEELFGLAQELGVRMVVCDMSRELLGVKDAELVDGLETGGVATFLGDAARAKVTLFI